MIVCYIPLLYTYFGKKLMRSKFKNQIQLGMPFDKSPI